VYKVAERLGYVRLKPRSNSPLGLVAKYDGNVAGGALLGAGMALSGACPGTLLTQVAAGARTGLFALGGALLGGIIWSGPVSALVKGRNERAAPKVDAATLADLLGVSPAGALAVLEAAFITVIATATMYAPRAPEPRILGAVGGLLIGSAQLFSILTRRTMMGVSGSYEEAGNYFWRLVGSAGADTKPRSYQNIVFATGVAGGAWALSRAVPELLLPATAGAAAVEPTPLAALVGALLMVVGSRMAGGCPSGHGISGMSLLSISSVVTIASAFGAGAVVATSLY
jgi:uncharacterized membrane protein YedE/YeeE